MSLHCEHLSGDTCPLPHKTGLSSTLTNIILDPECGKSSLLIQTGTTPSLFIDKYSNIGINTTAPCTQVDISSNNGACLRLRNTQGSTKSDIFVHQNGDLVLIPDNETITNKSFDIKCHDGSSSGLKLGGELVRVTAEQLNRLIGDGGMTCPLKAVVTNEDNDINGINTLSANKLIIDGSTLQTEVSYLSGSMLGSGNAGKVLVLDLDKRISGIESLSANVLHGTLLTSAQPNITSVGNLSSLTVEGPLSANDISGTMVSSNQPNITSLGTLNNLSIKSSNPNALILSSTADNIYQVFDNNIYQLTTGIRGGANEIVWNYNGADRLAISTDGNVRIGGNASMYKLNVAGTVNAANYYLNENALNFEGLPYISGITPGVASYFHALVLNAESAISGISALGTSTLILGGTSLTATNASYISNLVVGQASIGKALVVDNSRSISNINLLSTNKLIVGNATTISTSNSAIICDSTIANGSLRKVNIGHSLTTKNSLWIGYYHSLPSSSANRLDIGFEGTNELVSLLPSGRLGIGTSSPLAPLHVAGFTQNTISGNLTYGFGSTSSYTGRLGSSSVNIGVSVDYGLRVGSTGIFVASDRRLKTNIRSIDNNVAIDFILKTEPRIYDLKEGTNTQLGYIAQELQASELGALVSYGFEKNNFPAESDDDIPNVVLVAQYERICCILHKGLQSALTRISELEKRLLQD